MPTGIGYSINQIYNEHGGRIQEHSFQDCSFNYNSNDAANISLYAIFDGYGDTKVATLAKRTIAAELLLGQLSGKTDDEEIKEALR